MLEVLTPPEEEQDSSRVCTPQASVLDDMTKVTTIQDTELLRGVHLRAVMRWFGAVLQSSHTRPGEKSYQLSHVVTSIDEFISHTWSTGRVVKFLALGLHYNAISSTLAAWTTGAVCSGLTLAGALPMMAPSWVENTNLTATVVGHLAFFMVFCFGQDLRRVLCPCSPGKLRQVFLDKICIHQQDEDIQKRGIRSLAGILRVSQTLLVLYSNRYLHRLWTVYEVASFLSLHQDTTRIVLLPTWWPPRLFILMGLFAMNSVLVHLTFPNSLVLYVVLFVANLFLQVLFFRQWQRHLYNIQQTIQKFSIREAACAVEADRSLVEANVKTFMQCLGRVGSEATEAAPLDAFDTMVKEELPGSILASFGRNAFPYRVCVMVTMTYMLRGMDQATDSFLAGDLRGGLSRLVYRGSIPFCLVPNLVFISNRMARAHLQLSGLAEFLFLMGLVLLSLLCSLLWAPAMVLQALAERQEGAMAWLALVGLLCFLLVTGTCGAWLFGERPIPQLSKEPPCGEGQSGGLRTRSKEPLVVFDETADSFSL